MKELLNKTGRVRIDKAISEFYQETFNIPSHRFFSWQHCYEHFTPHLKGGASELNEQELDLAALNLGFYLASWGMYRGSTFSLQRDYKIHIGCVKAITDKNYLKLKGASIESYLNDDDKIETLFDLEEKIIESYGPYKDKNQEVTDTLVTKILLGTLGCAPAYDRIFKNGLYRLGKPIKFKRECFKKFMEDLRENEQNYHQFSQHLPKKSIHYPPMKIIDMYYWAYGLKVKDKNNKAEYKFK